MQPEIRSDSPGPGRVACYATPTVFILNLNLNLTLCDAVASFIYVE
ncbi:hypothetical protein [Anaerosolibacter sp.]|nr:hypothetical protein [Anaerosolibacter sp.]